MTATIAVTNEKGGVGKTATAVSLGSALARRGSRVLIVDIDGQANATSALGIGKDLVRSVHGVLLRDESPDQAIIATSVQIGRASCRERM